MDGETPITKETFNGELEILIQFGMRSFYYNISLPNPLLVDDLLFNLIEILVSFSKSQIEAGKAVEKIQTLKSNSSSFPAWQNSLTQISDNIMKDSNPQKYSWELASNLACLSQEYLNYIKSTSLIFNLPVDAYLERQIQLIQTHIHILSTCKPKDARDPKPISFNLSNPEVGASFNSFAQAKTTSLPKCCICTEPATWFAFPCSHPIYCELDYNDSLEGDFLYTNCPICDKQIEKYVNIQLPK